MSATPAPFTTQSLSTKLIDQAMGLLKHWRLALLLFFLALSAGLTYYVYCKPVYRGKSLVKFNFINLPIHSESSGKETPYYLLRRSLIADFNSPHLVERTAMRLGLVDEHGSYGNIKDSLIKEIKIQFIDDFKFSIEVFPYRSELAWRWGEAMVEEYKSYQAELRMEYNEQAIASYNQELEQIRKRLLDSLEQRLNFEAESEFAEQTLKAAEYNRMLVDLFMIRQQILAAERTEAAMSNPGLDPVEKVSLLAAFATEINSQIEPVIAPTAPSKGPIAITAKPGETILIETDSKAQAEVKRLRERRDQLLAEREEAAKKFLSGHPRMIDLDRQLSLIENQIDREAEATVANFRNQLAQLKEAEKELETQLPSGREAMAALSKKELEFGLMTTQLPWEQAYAEAQKRLQAINFGGDKERIVLHHEKVGEVNRTPVSPNKMKLLYASCALGLALAFGIPFGLQRLDNTASKLDQLERELQLKGLGIVPKTPKGELEDIVRAPEAEARVPNSLLENFRVIRAGIALNQSAGQPAQVLMVTSARPSEGKTVNACNLGWAFASIREPTLLIDSDLRRGRVHTVLDLPNDRGLSRVLAGDLSIDEAIQPTKVPNLWALTRGPVIAGVTERFFISEHDARIRELRQRFTRIIMDTPPVLGLSETATLMRVVDGVVLIVRAERTSRRDIADATTILRKSAAHIFGFVLNRLDLDRIGNYYNYYYYSSSYYDQMVDNDYDGPVGARDLKL